MRSLRIAPGRRAALFGLAALLGLAALPAGADWLVTRQGGRVEIRGSWEVKGKLVVFRTLDGTLSSLRLSDVDLEASRKATEEAERARAAASEARLKPKATERKPPILVVTDKDVRHIEDAPSGAAAVPGEEPQGETTADGLTVTTWERSSDAVDGHVVVSGTLANTAEGSTATGITLSIALFDETGREVARADAVLTSTALPSRQQSGFRAQFPGVYAFANLKFEPQGLQLKTGPPEEPAPVAEGG